MKSVEEIYAGLTADFARRTGMEVAASGDMAARMYALAAQLSSLYAHSEWVARQCFPQTASGEYLERHAQVRGLARREAVAAVGKLRFGVEEALSTDLTIPVGTVCMTAGLVRFETVKEGILPAGETTVDVAARAVEVGTAGNTGAGTVLSMAVAPVGVSWVNNPEPFAGGTDREEDEALRERVLESFQRLPNGANAAFYEQGALAFGPVAAVNVLPRVRGRGTVDVVLATTAGLPDEALLGQVQDWFEQRREIAVDVSVRAPEVKTVDVAVSVQVREDMKVQTVLDEVERAVRDWFDGRRLGKNVLRAALGQVVYGVDGVENYSLTAPMEDLAVEWGELPMLGTLTVEGMA